MTWNANVLVLENLLRLLNLVLLACAIGLGCLAINNH